MNFLRSLSVRLSKISGRALFGWAAFIFVLVLLAVVGYRTVHYYQLLKAGDIIDLAGVGGRFTLGASLPGAASEATVAESDLDVANAASLGPAADKAKATVVMFGDFECQYSKEGATIFRRLATRYNDQVRFVYRDFPLQTIHAGAFPAAAAARCAKEQGKFWEYFDRLYAHAPDFSESDLILYGKEAGLDSARFAQCVKAGRYNGQVDADLVAVKKLGLRGTPTFFVNGRKVEGLPSESDFERIIVRLLK